MRPPASRENLPDLGTGIAPWVGTRKRTAFPPPARDGSTKTGAARTRRGQRPARRGLCPPAGLGTAGRCGRGDGPCHGSGAVGSHSDCSPSPGGNRKRMRFPRPRETLPPRPVPPAPTEASARPGGREAPAGSGRALAGGFGPPAGVRSAWRCGRGDGPCQGNDAVPPPLQAGPRNALRFPAPRGPLPPRPVQPAPTAGQRPTRRARSARRVGASAGRGLWGTRRADALCTAWPGRWPPPARAGRGSPPLSGQAAPAAGTVSAPCPGGCSIKRACSVEICGSQC